MDLIYCYKLQHMSLRKCVKITLFWSNFLLNYVLASSLMFKPREVLIFLTSRYNFQWNIRWCVREWGRKSANVTKRSLSKVLTHHRVGEYFYLCHVKMFFIGTDDCVTVETTTPMIPCSFTTSSNCVFCFFVLTEGPHAAWITYCKSKVSMKYLTKIN